MKVFNWIVAAALIGVSLPAQAATSDPLKVTYTVSGVYHIINVAATVVSCTSASAVSENIQVLVKDHDGVIQANTAPVTVLSGHTYTWATQSVQSLDVNAFLLNNPNSFSNQGTLAVLSTSPSIYCSTVTVAFSGNVPQGMALHMVRFNSFPGSVGE